ncbi:MAG: type II secretion system F family protein [Deltaproteobacteria bacterium]|nr:type II secretion system F family protein [Deltaproteobacteria bacterium]
MPVFLYKSRDSKGTLVSGEMEAANADDVRRNLSEKGLLPTRIEPKGLSISIPQFFRQRSKGKVRDLIALTRQFYALFKAGVNMDRILFTLARQSENSRLRIALEEIRRDVSKGSGLAAAFGKHPDIFNELYVNMLSVGETGGVLEQSLLKLVEILKKEHKLITSVKSATLYPKIVIVVFFMVVALMIVFVIPRFADFYAGFKAELPLPTRILIAVSDFVSAYWYFFLAGIAFGTVFVRRLKNTSKGNIFFDRLRFKIPVFGKLHQLVINARFGHLVAAMYKSGLPLATALDIVGRTIGNKVFQKEIEGLNDDVSKGSSLSASMEAKPYFTFLMTETTAVGEQTGSLDEMMETTAQFYDEEIDAMLVNW